MLSCPQYVYRVSVLSQCTVTISTIPVIRIRLFWNIHEMEVTQQ